MTFRIGVDFDNTIACYDHVFSKITQAKEQLSKKDIKQRILSEPNGDITWQKLQGQVYGKYMHWATLFPGFVEFLCLSKLRGHSVFIVSHKSEYGHFDEEKISLRTAAMNWITTMGLPLSQDRIFFESTREAKINRIRALDCTHFIDDLQEVFEEPEFPKHTQKILFDTSWRLITQQLYEDWSDAEVCLAVQERFPGLNVQQAELIKGRGNSRIFKLTGREGEYALKIYPNRQLDERPRLETEFSACRALMTAGFPVIKALAKDEQLNWAVYSWTSGNTIQSPDKNFIDEAAKFMQALQLFSRHCEEAKPTKQSTNETWIASACSRPRNDELLGLEKFPEASEACLSGAEIERQIRERLKHLDKVESVDLKQFLNEEFLPDFNDALQIARENVGNLFETPLARHFQILSPSDFGAHNAMQDESGRTVFIDFEYFGWDDPVKLVCDFYFHPGMDLSKELKEQWLEYSKKIFQKDVSFETRLTAYLPLFALRWSLILLNVFLPNRQSVDKTRTYLVQLNKAKSLLKYGSALQIS